MLAHCNMTHLKKRDNMRLAHNFSMLGLDNLQEELQRVEESGRVDVAVKYYELSLKYCLSETMKKDLI